MSTYSELREKIAELEQQAEAARRKELESAISKIKELMQEYGITTQDIEASGGRKLSSKSRSSVPVKYKDPVSGQTWTGRGRAPRWLDGRKKEDFLIS